MRKPEDTTAHARELEIADNLLKWVRSMPRSTDQLASTWTYPEWEQIVDWWDRAKDMAEGK